MKQTGIAFAIALLTYVLGASEVAAQEPDCPRAAMGYPNCAYLPIGTQVSLTQPECLPLVTNDGFETNEGLWRPLVPSVDGARIERATEAAHSGAYGLLMQAVRGDSFAESEVAVHSLERYEVPSPLPRVTLSFWYRLAEDSEGRGRITVCHAIGTSSCSWFSLASVNTLEAQRGVWQRLEVDVTEDYHAWRPNRFPLRIEAESDEGAPIWHLDFVQFEACPAQ